MDRQEYEKDEGDTPRKPDEQHLTGLDQRRTKSEPDEGIVKRGKN